MIYIQEYKKEKNKKLMKFIQNKIFNKFDVECKIEKNIAHIKTTGKMGAIEKKLKLKRDIFKINGIYYFKNHSDSRNVIGAIKQLIQSVLAGYCIELKLVGLGYAVHKVGNKIIIDVGYSHYISCTIPKDLILKLEGTTIILYSINKELVTTFASRLRRIKKVNPYKGTGILGVNEKIKLKKGKVR